MIYCRIGIGYWYGAAVCSDALGSSLFYHLSLFLCFQLFCDGVCHCDHCSQWFSRDHGRWAMCIREYNYLNHHPLSQHGEKIVLQSVLVSLIRVRLLLSLSHLVVFKQAPSILIGWSIWMSYGRISPNLLVSMIRYVQGLSTQEDRYSYRVRKISDGCMVQGEMWGSDWVWLIV